MKWKPADGAKKSFSQKARKSSAVQPAKEPSTTNTELSQSTMEDPSQKEPSTSLTPGSRIASVAPGKSYELSALQYRHLDTAANVEGMVMMVVSPNFHDTAERARELQNSCNDYDDLLALGLVDDVSEHYQDNVREAWNEQGRHIRFMFISQAGALMFARYEGDKERKPN